MNPVTHKLSLNPPLAAPPIVFKVVNEYRHDSKAYTEGLVFCDGYLYESTGGSKEQLPLSTVRRVELETGKVLAKVVLNEKHFAEGLTVFGNQIFQLTDKSKIAFVYNLKHFGRTPTLRKYDDWDRGWGLTHDNQYLILSDDTECIRFVNSQTFKTIKTISVNDSGTLKRGLNELEYANGKIYANLYPFNLIVVIDPVTGNILGQIDLTPISFLDLESCFNCVPNGIAQNKETGNFYVTGKNWPKLFEIQLL